MSRQNHSKRFDHLLEKHKFIVLDGGLATQLEKKGLNLDHPLWSAKLLHSHPNEIRETHLAYLKAGADCFYTISYQLSYTRCRAMGMTDEEVTAMLNLSVNLAVEARTEFLDEWAQSDRMRPLIAASIGPYGAYLADGSEYGGNYIVSDQFLLDFHEKRWKVMAHSAIDLMACETIPNFTELKVLAKLITETGGKPACISLSIRDDAHLADGTPLEKVAAFLSKIDQLVAIGVNCTDPRNIPGVIQVLKIAAPKKAVLVYPNSGEIYNAKTKSWEGETCAADFGQMALEWYELGARWIGGCCRTEPEHIKAIREALQGN